LSENELLWKRIKQLEKENKKLKDLNASFFQLINEGIEKMERHIEWRNKYITYGVGYHRTIYMSELYSAEIKAYEHCIKIMKSKLRRLMEMEVNDI
jgi:hypothetical protein